MRVRIPSLPDVIHAVFFTRTGRITLVILVLIGVGLSVGMSLLKPAVRNTFSSIMSSLTSPTP